MSRLRSERTAALAALISATSPLWMAPDILAREAAMLLNTVVSCAATPFTVSTRFGIRSLRRCSCVSMLPLALLTASSLVWIWL